MKAHLSYMICCLPRTGSWLLAEGLQSTGLAGRPREFFAPETQQSFLNLWNMPPESGYAEYLDRVIEEATTPNGVLGVKVHWYQCVDLLQKLRTVKRFSEVPTESLLSLALPNLRYIHLIRRDKVRHAVSYARASETKLWWEIDSPNSPTRRVLAKTPRFDIAKLDRFFQTLVEHDRAWRQYFRMCGVTPLTLSYEELAKDQRDAVRHVLEYLEMPIALSSVTYQPRLKKQSDGLSELWVQEYRRIRNSRQSFAQ